MPIKVQAQGQTFTFPDGTTEVQIGEALDSHFIGTASVPQPKAIQIDPQGLTPDQLNRLEELQGQFAQEQSALARSNIPNPIQAGLIGVGKGIIDVGNVISGVVGGGKPQAQIQGEQQAFEQLKETNPVTSRIGEFVGETLATAPIGGLAGSLAKSITTKVATTLGAQVGGRVATTAGVAIGGGAEGAAVAAQLGEDATTGAALGAGANLAMPLVFRAGKRVFQSLTGRTATEEIFDQAGNLTESATQELQAAGVPIETFAADVENALKQNFNPEVDLTVQARQAQLQEFAPGADGRVSRLTKDQSAQDAEEALIRLGTPEGEAIVSAERQLQEQLQQGAESKLLGDLDVDLISRFNSVSDDANKGVLGESAKLAIADIRAVSKEKVTALYNSARDLAGDGQEVFTDNILNTFGAATNELAPSDGLMGATGRALKEFGIIPEGSELGDTFKFKAPVELKPLTLDNAEKLRQRLNKLDPRDGSQDALFVDMVRRQLDLEVEGLIDQFPAEAATAIAFKKARNASAEFKQTFNDKQLVSQLVDFKKGTKDVDKIAPEKVLDTLLRSDLRSAQKVKSLMLENSTPDSIKAWNEMKFTVIDEILRGSMNKQTGALSGVRLNTELSKIGDSRLKLLLGNEKFNQLKRFQTVLSDQTIPMQRLENPSGTSGPILAMLGTMGDLMKGSANAATGGLVSSASKNNAKRAMLEGALKDIQSATGRTGRVKRIKAQKVISEFLRELAVVGVSTLGQE